MAPVEVSTLAHLTNDNYVLRLPQAQHAEFAMLSTIWGDVPDNIQDGAPVLYDFLTRVDWADFTAIKQKTGGEWQYKTRYSAQQVLPFIYLGPTSVAKDLEFLTTARISMILPIRNTGSSEFRLGTTLRSAVHRGIQVTPLDVFSPQSSTLKLSLAIRAINTHLSQPQYVDTAVLVCCESGNVRSAAVVVAYCMNTLGMPLEHALRLVQGARFSVGFDDSIKSILTSYGDVVRAQRDVEQNNNVEHEQPVLDLPRLPIHGFKRRRSGDDDDEDDIDMQLEDDVARFTDRSFTPFAG